MCLDDSEVVIASKSLRRSSRKSNPRCEDTETINTNQSLRRSSRKSVLQMYQNRRQSVRLAKLNESVEMQSRERKSGEVRASKERSKRKNVANNITLIDVYCNGSANTKTSLSKHRKAVLDLLNKGSMKELQILPQIGQKTAYQIVTQRFVNILTSKLKHIYI